MHAWWPKREVHGPAEVRHKQIVHTTATQQVELQPVLTPGSCGQTRACRPHRCHPGGTVQCTGQEGRSRRLKKRPRGTVEEQQGSGCNTSPPLSPPQHCTRQPPTCGSMLVSTTPLSSWMSHMGNSHNPGWLSFTEQGPAGSGQVCAWMWVSHECGSMRPSHALMQSSSTAAAHHLHCQSKRTSPYCPSAGKYANHITPCLPIARVAPT